MQILMPYPLLGSDGFILLDSLTMRLVYLDDQEKFQKQERLDQIVEWPQNTKWETVFPDGVNQALVHFRRWEDKSFLLGALNLKDKTLKIIWSGQPESDGFRRRFLPFGEYLLEFVPETGQIDLVSRDFQFIKNLFPEQETVKRDSNRFRHLSRRLPYLTLLGTPHVLAGPVANFHWRENRSAFLKEGDGNPWKSMVFTLEEGIRFSQVKHMGTWQGKRLVFDWDEGELKVERIP